MNRDLFDFVIDYDFLFLIIVFIQSLKSSFRRGLHAPHVHHSACDTIDLHVQLSMIYCPFRALMVFAVTCRVAAGWLVLPFQGERMTVTHKRKNAPV
ncbi:MAG: hypothetical protein LBG58_17315 [Planctomycetaceae bacterium]|nr:hypothetical protein [Planctomycetaceae bacterium]